MHNNIVFALENLTTFKQHLHYNRKWSEVKAHSFCKYRSVKDMKV